MNKPLTSLPIIKICPSTGERFTCGAGTGKCWCMEYPPIKVESDLDCYGPTALKRKAIEQGKLFYTYCPKCNIQKKTSLKCDNCGLHVGYPDENTSVPLASFE
jgi:hypothetical protein